MDANSRKPNTHGVAAEPDQVRTSVVLGLFAVLAGSGAVALVVVFALFHVFESHAEKTDDASIAAAGLEQRPDVVPPSPRLQVYPVRHWKDFHAAELDRLSTYGWMDRSSGAVHVPIDRAMDLVVERGVGPLSPAPMAMPETAPVATAPSGAKK